MRHCILTQEPFKRETPTPESSSGPFSCLEINLNQPLRSQRCVVPVVCLYNLALPAGEVNNPMPPSILTSSHIIGAESASKKVIGDTSDLRGFKSTYWVFPETESAVLVLTNASNANGDSSNIVGQVLTQTLFNLKPTINYLSLDWKCAPMPLLNGRLISALAPSPNIP